MYRMTELGMCLIRNENCVCFCRGSCLAPTVRFAVPIVVVFFSSSSFHITRALGSVKWRWHDFLICIQWVPIVLGMSLALFAHKSSKSPCDLRSENSHSYYFSFIFLNPSQHGYFVNRTYMERCMRVQQPLRTGEYMENITISCDIR